MTPRSKQHFVPCQTSQQMHQSRIWLFLPLCAHNSNLQHTSPCTSHQPIHMMSHLHVHSLASRFSLPNKTTPFFTFPNLNHLYPLNQYFDFRNFYELPTTFRTRSILDIFQEFFLNIFLFFSQSFEMHLVSCVIVASM